MSREFQVFVKPVGARCNLDCHYCYYLDKENLNPDDKHKVMAEEVLEKYIPEHLDAAGESTVMFSWHGGEPTLAGIDFFRKAVEIQKRHCPSGVKILNGIQTNGTLLDREWGEFLASEEFVVGISMDGPSRFHNRFRVAKDQSSSFTQVLRGYNLLQEFRIRTEILCVVNAYNVNYPLEVYGFFKEFGVQYLTFLPLVERVPGSARVSEASVPSLAFGKFLCSVFDEWTNEDIGIVKIQIIEEAARTAFKQDHTLCIFKRTCGGVPVIEQNGDFYSCDHYAEPVHHLGNITNDSLISLLDHPAQKAFGAAKEKSLPLDCRECEVLDMCNGECPKNRFINTPNCRPFVDAVAARWN